MIVFVAATLIFCTAELAPQTRGIVDPEKVSTLKSSAYNRLLPYTTHEYTRYALAPPGREHYRLLALFAQHVGRNEHVIDVGTRYGTSALVMAAAGHNITVHTVDTVGSPEFRSVKPPNSILDKGSPSSDYDGVATWSALPNVFFYRCNLLNAQESTACGNKKFISVLQHSRLLVLDTNHLPESQPFEYQFIAKLQRLGFRGLIVLDDIHLNAEMERFWGRLSASYLTRDVTKFGHSTGTGLLWLH